MASSNRVSTWRVMVQFAAANLTGQGFASIISSINQAHTSTQNLNNAINSLKIAGGAALTDFGLKSIDVFTKAAEAAGNYQQQLVLLQQSMGRNPSVAGLSALSQQRLNLLTGPQATIFDLTTLANIQRQLLSAGFDPTEITRTGSRGGSLGQIVTYLSEVEALKHVGPGTPEGTAKNLSKFLRGYGLTGQPAYDTLDTFAKAQSVTAGFTSSSVRNYEQYFGLLARTLGIKPQDFIMLAGFMSRLGFSDSTGATSLQNLFTQGLDLTKGVTSYQTNQRFQAAVDLGILGTADPKRARKLIFEQERRMRELGLPADLSQLTSSQEERLAKSGLIGTMPNLLFQAYKQHGLGGMADFFQVMRGNEERAFGGKALGDEHFVRDVNRLFNIRGGRGAYAVGTPGALRHYIGQVTGQQDIDVLIQQARDTLQGQEATAQSRFNAILLSLGGVSLVTGKAIPGGPLSSVIKLLHSLNLVMDAIIKFGSTHQSAMAHIGTAIGVFGAISTLLGAILAGAGVVGLIRSGIGPGGAAAIGGVLAGGRGLLSHMAPPTGFLKGMWEAPGAVKSVATTMAKDFTWAIQDYANHGHFLPQNIGKMNWGQLWHRTTWNLPTSSINLFEGGLVKLGLRFVNWIGWVTLAVDALSFFSKHPKLIGEWIAGIIKSLVWLVKEGGSLFMTFIKFIGDELKKLKDFVTGAGQFGNWWAQLTTSIQDNLKPPTTPARGSGQHHVGARDIHLHTTVNGAGGTDADRKKLARDIAKHQVSMLRRAGFATSGGMGIPGYPAAHVGSA